MVHNGSQGIGTEPRTLLLCAIVQDSNQVPSMSCQKSMPGVPDPSIGHGVAVFFLVDLLKSPSLPFGSA